MIAMPPWVAETFFLVSLFFNLRSIVKFMIDWHGLRATDRFIRAAYAARERLPSIEDLRRDAQTPQFMHLVAAFHEPEIDRTLKALLSLRYPAENSRVVVITKEEEDRLPHPGMGASTGTLIRRFREGLSPHDRRRLLHLVMPGRGRKAEQLNWALRPESLREALGEPDDKRRVFVTVSDADSIPDPDLCRWIVAHQRSETEIVAYQGLPLSFANFDRLPTRGRICAIQQSSIFIRVCVARLLGEPLRARIVERLRSVPAGRWIAPFFELFFRRSHICLGHNEILRLDALTEIGGFPTSGATEDSTLGYEIGRRGWLLAPSPMIELVDLPDTPEKVIRQSARWYLGALDDVRFLWRSWRSDPTAFNLAQFLRHLGNRALEWPTSLLFYPFIGWVGWRLAWDYPHYPLVFYAAIAAPLLSIGLTLWVCGVVIPSVLAGFQPYLPASIDLGSRSWLERILRVVRSQAYWLLSTLGTWRVLACALRATRYEPGKTDRVTAPASSPRAALRGAST